MTSQPIVREFEADLTVLEAATVAEDVVALTLASADGATLPPWTPGAHVDLVLAEDLVRQYSLCGNPADPGSWRVGVLRAPDSRGGSKTVHAELGAGATVKVRGPRNHFPFVASQRYLFLAGGIGITPMLPMILEAEASGADWRLVYGGRSLSSMAFRDELEAYGDRVTLVPQDTDGFPDLDGLLGTPQPDTLVYACGPTPFLDAIETRCAVWPAGALHLERFAAKEVDTGDDEAFELVLQRSGLTLEVPADRSIFEVCRDAGVSVVGSCLEGVCGTCETEVVDGDVDHRDSILNDEEKESNEFMMICVSRCKGSQLTLDL